jgi:hypothetical protein
LEKLCITATTTGIQLDAFGRNLSMELWKRPTDWSRHCESQSLYIARFVVRSC